MSVPVKFTYIEQNKLESVPIINGQIIAVTDAAGYYYDWNGNRYLVNSDHSAGNVIVGQLDSSSNVSHLIITASGVTQLVDGTAMYVVNNLSDISGSPDLTINSLGVYPVFDAITGSGQISYPVHSGALFIYSSARTPGGSWDMLAANLSPESMGDVHAECTGTPVDAVYEATVDAANFHLMDGSLVSVTFYSAVVANAAVEFHSPSVTTAALPIHYLGSLIDSDVISAGNTALLRCVGDPTTSGSYLLLLTIDSLIEEVRTLESAVVTESIYWCKYNNTTYLDINRALNNNQLCVMYYQSRLYFLTDHDRNSYYFTSFHRAEFYQVYCSEIDNSWSDDETLVFAIVDPTFQQYYEAADSRITGQRFNQLDKLITDSLYTTDNSSQLTFNLLGIDPNTGRYSDLLSNVYSTNPRPYTSSLLFTLGSSLYEWCVWAYDADHLSGPGTHPAGVTGYVNASCSLYLAHEDTDYAYILAIRNVDHSPISNSELQWIANNVSIRSMDISSDSIVFGTSVCTVQNNSMLVDQLVAVAQTYFDGRNDKRPDNTFNMQFGHNTILDTSENTNQLDAATWVGLVLRGIPYADTSYYTYNFVSPDAWVADPTYTWACNLQLYSNAVIPGLSTSPIRTASQLAEWMVSQGRQVPLDKNFMNVQAGDLVFYANKDAAQNWNNPSGYLHIDDVCICIDVVNQSYGGFPRTHILMYVGNRGTSSPCLGQTAIEYSILDRDNLCLVCRPDLGSISGLVAKTSKIDPVSPLSKGTPGQMMYDNDTLYICVATNQWKQVALSNIS